MCVIYTNTIYGLQTIWIYEIDMFTFATPDLHNHRNWITQNWFGKRLHQSNVWMWIFEKKKFLFDFIKCSSIEHKMLLLCPSNVYFQIKYLIIEKIVFVRLPDIVNTSSKITENCFISFPDAPDSFLH